MDEKFKILDETLAYKRYLSIMNRTVKYPDGRQISWDVAGSQQKGPNFATCFPYFTATQKVRVCREYCQGVNGLRYTLCAGGYDLKKHRNIRECCEMEMEEEARLKGGTLVCLIDELGEGISELKWSTNTFIPYVCIDPVASFQGKRDMEECIEFKDVSIKEFMEIILKGEMMLPSVQTGLMAIDYLKRNQYLE